MATLQPAREEPPLGRAVSLPDEASFLSVQATTTSCCQAGTAMRCEVGCPSAKGACGLDCTWRLSRGCRLQSVACHPLL